MSSEDFKSFIVTNPDLVDEGIDVSGLRTTTDTSPYLLGNIPDYGGIKYEAYNPNRLSDLMRFYSQGLPMFDTPQAEQDFTGGQMIEIGGGGGGGGGGTTPTQPDSIGGFDPGVIPGPSGFIGLDPDMDIDIRDYDDAQNYEPPTPPSGITGDSIEMENLSPIDIGTVDDYDDLNDYENAVAAANISGTISGAPVVGDFDNPTTGTISDDRLNEVIGGQPMAAGPFDYLQEQTPISQVKVPGVTQADLTQAQIDAERLGSYKPSFDTSEQENTVQNIFGKVGQTVEGALTELGKIPGAIVDFGKQKVDIFGKKLNVGETLLKAGINKLAGGPITLVFDLLGGLPKDSLENSTTRSIVAQLAAEKDYGFNMGNQSIGQDIFGRNPVSTYGDYEQTLKEDLLGINQSGFQTAKMREKKQEFARDYFNAKAERAGGVEQTSGISEEAGGTGIVSTGDVLGPGEFLPEGEDLVSLEDQLAEQAAAEQAQAAKIEAERRELQEINARAEREAADAANAAAAQAAAIAAQNAAYYQSEGGGGGGGTGSVGGGGASPGSAGPGGSDEMGSFKKGGLAGLKRYAK